MRLQILNEQAYNAFSNKPIESVYRFNPDEWRCTLPHGWMLVKVTAAVVSIGVSTREDEVGYEMCLVGGVTNKKDALFINPNKIKLTFKEIIEFMKWQVDEEQIWDG